ncbi:large subunit ribosomal protein LP0 [Sphaeroforma arctica JP610]|uniref:60S acidic ribosomal protein P0 n=1 Tax=Sphaeroforma arctica JP610 TaxID=667725 RepID=A0A0L0FQ07_9EUKA|nr:large subunit ribosomal protein LP0 [Sphaeroforma arctica JP610]KNC78895.1 large subunit ribosomal protein LP0 [Sphaeroforma arctica JP610]|eukprot:XP_014152797.1 large subunit ribosomal protein LP0 [Sphaeroforma arctica JP610]
MSNAKVERKAAYFERLLSYFDKYSKCFIVGVDNVGSNQMQQIRKSLRGKGEVLMGKNTLIRKALRGAMAENPNFHKLLSVVKNNVGFVFTNDDLCEVRDLITSFKVAAPAKTGAIAPIDVHIPAGSTGMDPGKISFFQALNITTKIQKGAIEIVNPVHLIKEDTRVDASAAVLLNMLKISPFSYGLKVFHVFEGGSLYDPEVLDIKEDDLLKEFSAAVANVASISLAIGYPTVAAIPHMFINSYKNVLAIACETDITFPLAEKAKEFLADPEAALAAMAANAPAAPAGGDAAAPAAAAAAPEPEEESEEEDMGFGLFD